MSNMTEEELILMLRRSRMWPNVLSCLSLNKIGKLCFGITIKEDQGNKPPSILHALGGV